jgi:hypothetical protein
MESVLLAFMAACGTTVAASKLCLARGDTLVDFHHGFNESFICKTNNF